ncbi:MAG: FKBP-type peptidyl-prolyl cis-trans isomerase [Halobacteria archaeon]|nr:FKBP-type peptidyl-prolyl cis-trans isomerase [Halobacteria archaeon]
MSVSKGDTITVQYIGRFEDGGVFDTSRKEVAEEAGVYDPQREYEPLTFEAGGGDMIQGFDEAVIGMEEGEEKEVTIPPEKGYGEHDPELVEEYEKEQLEEALGQEPQEGMHLHIEGTHGDVAEVEGDTVKVDFNPHLAGETLVFEIELLEIE